MQYGQQNIAGHWYYLQPYSGLVLTGFQSVYDGGLKHNKTVYYNQDGQMQYGQQHINGNWYYFAEPTGAMQTGFQQLPGKKVYYNNQGQMQYGQQYIDGHWYYFQPYSGMMLTGFQSVYDGNLRHNKTVYYNDQGQMLYGWQQLGWHEYYFNTVSGAMNTGWSWAGNQWLYFDNNGVFDGFNERVLEWFYNHIGRLTYSMCGSRMVAMEQLIVLVQ